MAQLARFTTAGTTPADALARWDAQLWQGVLPVQTEAVDGPFAAEASVLTLGAVHVYRISASSNWRACHAGTDLPAAPGTAGLIVQRRGHIRVTQYRREAALAPDQWTLCDARRPFSIVSEGAGEQLLLLLPRERLALSAAELSGHAACRFGDAGGTARLLSRYLAGLVDELGTVDEGNCADLVDMAAQLVRLALFEARRAAPMTSMRDTMRARIKEHVRRHLRDPGLTIDGVAAAFGCTKRHLHKVFSEDATTLNQFIRSERLARCHDALDNPILARRSITEIAFMWGFNNSAHFSKAFKERYGVPPGHVRRRTHADGALALN